MLGKNTQQIDYQNFITGTWGEFSVADSRVSYLQTKAKIGKASKDPEKRLTSQLRPVREVLPTSSMDFNQLLQRDLDDHRVAANLVKYILQPKKGRPVYFPPIVAALLPFDGNAVKSTFPEMHELKPKSDSAGITWSGYFCGNAFKFEKVVEQETGEDYSIKIGKLSWNPEEGKLVVIDGQHRAMALLAIDRTLNNTWSESGEKYKYFYEPIVREITLNMDAEQKDALIAQLEFPVNLIWFPESNTQDPKHHEVARRLFVDINKNARTPSESRILLLSDNDLLSIFTRKLLNAFRSSTLGLPIYAVEYDHPGRDQASSSKWSAISNVMTLRDVVSRTVFGPKKYIEFMDAKIGSRESQLQRGRFMQSTLRIGDEIPEALAYMTRDNITEEDFPREHSEFLQERFQQTWGDFFYRVLSEARPFKDHGDALKQLQNNWATAGSADTLAKDAIFEGVGMYWTIKDASLHWEAENRLREDADLPPKDPTDIVKTWRVLNEKALEFREIRARIYLGKSSETEVELSNAAFDVMGTNACQVGLALAVRSIAHDLNLTIEELPDFFTKCINAINQALASGPDAKYGRRLFLSRVQPKDTIPRLNLMPKLDTPLAVYFRSLWLELLASDEASAVWSDTNWDLSVSKLRDLARSHYLNYVCAINEKALRSQNPTMSSSDVKLKAKEQAEKSLHKALKHWFGLDQTAWNAWLLAPPAASGVGDLTDVLDDVEAASVDPSEESAIQEDPIS